MNLGLRWTGNYMMDMAAAGLTVFAEKDNPELLTAEDLKKFQIWAERVYFAPDLTSWISVVFTSNFMNPSFSLEKKKEVLRDVLTSFERPGLLPVPCAFFPELPAQQRVARDLFPMLMGRGPMNFYPDGQPGLPLSGLAITALQGLSLATPLVSGRALLLDADDPVLLLQVVRTWHAELMRRAELSLSSNARLDKWAAPRTRLIEALRNIMAQRPASTETAEGSTGGATIYHLSNSGQGPDVQISILQQPVIRFLENAERRFNSEWNALVSVALRPADGDKDAQYGTKNDLDEALFDLPDNSPRFIGRFFTPVFRRAAFPPEPKPVRKGKRAVDTPVSAPAPLRLGRVWALTALFLREVVGMDKERVRAIETLGTALGTWIADENDRPLFRSVYEVRGAAPMRHLLLKATFDKAKQDAEKGPPKADQTLLITPELYLRVFMETDEIARADFTLARDLLKMRVIQVLHEADFFNKNRGAPELEQAGLDEEGTTE